MLTGFMLKALLISFAKFALSFSNCGEVAFASKNLTEPSVFGSQYTAINFPPTLLLSVPHSPREGLSNPITPSKETWQGRKINSTKLAHLKLTFLSYSSANQVIGFYTVPTLFLYPLNSKVTDL